MLNSTQPTYISSEDRVAAIAYALWLEEGQPHGRAEAHWFKALELAHADAPAKAPAAADEPKRKPAASAAKKSAPRKRS